MKPKRKRIEHKKSKRPFKNKKGVIGLFFLFIFFSILLLFLFAFAVPLLIQIDTSFYTAGEDIFINSQDTINSIQNDTIKAEIQGSINSAKESIPEQISILSTFHKYGWLIIIIIILFILFMQSRIAVETDTRIQ